MRANGADYHVPFGGTKGSSFGTREQGRYAKETQFSTGNIRAELRFHVVGLAQAVLHDMGE